MTAAFLACIVSGIALSVTVIKTLRHAGDFLRPVAVSKRRKS